MKRLRIIIFTLLTVVLPVASQAAPLGFARISLIQGDVQIRNEDADDWVPAAANTPLQEGDSVWCPEGSRAELQFLDGTVVRLDDRTAFDIVALDEHLMQFHQGMGRIYVRSGRHAEDRTLQVDLPTTTVSVTNKSRFRVDIADDGDEEISIFRGAIYAESMGTRTRLRTGEMLSIDENSSEISPLKVADEWDAWNESRDRSYELRLGARHVPTELEIYSSDLDANGEWVSDQEYGYVWRPTAVAVDWSPYQVGRWVWVGGDYVWISSEPWGWAPYHYGRWIHRPFRGWCWVPPAREEVYWAPGYVGWVTTPTYVGWVPLAPGEVYYGRGYYGRNSINVTTVTNVTVTKVVYRNVTVTNAVTVVNRDGFASGRFDRVRPRENVFVRRDVAPGPPRFRPEKAAVMPALKKIPEAKLPPPRIRQIRVREIRERFPVVQPAPRPQARPEFRKPEGAGQVRPVPAAPQRPESRERRETENDRVRTYGGEAPSAAGRDRGTPAPERPSAAVEERKPAIRPMPQEPAQRDQGSRGEQPVQQPQQPRRDQSAAPAKGGVQAAGQAPGRPAAKGREVRKVWNVRQKEAPPAKKETPHEQGK